MRDLLGQDLDEGQRLHLLLAGQGPFERDSAFEPSLLPHVARLSHWPSPDLIEAATLFGRERGHPGQLPALWELTIASLTLRFGVDPVARDEWPSSGECRILRDVAVGIVARNDADDAIAAAPPERRHDLLARVARVHHDPDKVDRITRDSDPHDLDAEAVRSILIATHELGRDQDGGWVRAACLESAAGPGRISHVVAAVVDPDLRHELVGAAQELLAQGWQWAWHEAVVISQLAGHGMVEWVDRDDTATHHHPIWLQLLRRMERAEATDPFSALDRAHPFDPELDDLVGPHETSEGAGSAMFGYWGGSDAGSGAEPVEPDQPRGSVSLPASEPAPKPIEPDQPRGSVSLPELGEEPMVWTGGDEDDYAIEDDYIDDYEFAVDTPIGGEFDVPYDDHAFEDAGPPGFELEDEASEHRGARPDDRPRAAPPPRLAPPPAAVPSPVPPLAASEPPPAAPPTDDRRLGVDVDRNGQFQEGALVEGVTHALIVSIAPPGEATTQLGGPGIPVPFDDRDVVKLNVRFLPENGPEQRDTMRIRRSPRSRAETTFDFTPEGPSFEGLIGVYTEDWKVIEAAAISAPVVETENQVATSSDRIQIMRSSALELQTAIDGDTPVSVITNGQAVAATAGGRPLSASRTEAAAEIRTATAKLTELSRDAITWGEEPDVDQALRHLARIGINLRNRLQLSDVEVGEGLRILATSPSALLPLEFVYEGPAPDEDAVVCADWTTVEPGAPCHCDPADRKIVCPNRFWGLQTVVEHRPGSPTQRADFALPERWTPAAKPCGDLARVLTGASNLVLADLDPTGDAPSDDHLPARDPEETLEGFVTALGRPTNIADSWDDWVDRAADDPGLLVAMVHQTEDPGLELCGDVETVFEQRHVRSDENDPGPIVLLIGCEVAGTATHVGAFATDLHRHAPVVISTIGEVVAKEATTIATTVIGELDRARAGEDSVGMAVLRAKRQLLADRHLSAFQVVAHGDGRWRVG
ncbi:MAG: hypothetical protein AAF567_11490 [Actinomycetota bacterium]